MRGAQCRFAVQGASRREHQHRPHTQREREGVCAKCTMVAVEHNLNLADCRLNCKKIAFLFMSVIPEYN